MNIGNSGLDGLQAGHDVHPVDHHLLALLHGAPRQGHGAVLDDPRLLLVGEQQPVAGQVALEHLGRGERALRQCREQVRVDHAADDGADLVGADHHGDAQPVGHLLADGRLAHARGSTDGHDQRLPAGAHPAADPDATLDVGQAVGQQDVADPGEHLVAADGGGRGGRSGRVGAWAASMIPTTRAADTSAGSDSMPAFISQRAIMPDGQRHTPVVEVLHEQRGSARGQPTPARGGVHRHGQASAASIRARVRSRPEELDRLEQRRRDPPTGHGHPQRAERHLRLEPESLDQGRAQGRLDRRRRSTPSRSARAARAAVRTGCGVRRRASARRRRGRGRRTPRRRTGSPSMPTAWPRVSIRSWTSGMAAASVCGVAARTPGRA